jgi:hypothetical protein
MKHFSLKVMNEMYNLNSYFHRCGNTCVKISKLLETQHVECAFVSGCAKRFYIKI